MEPAQQSYAPSASERPYSENVATTNPAENGHGPATTSAVAPPEVGEVYSRELGSHYFLLGTLVLGLIGWLVALVSQAVVAAQINNPRIRILWFGIIIQTLVTALVVRVIVGSPAYNAAYAYGTQISVFAALATVFAVMGVDRNIYFSRSAEKATGAGWLIIAIVDLLWILYFTSPPQSPRDPACGGHPCGQADRRAIQQGGEDRAQHRRVPDVTHPSATAAVGQLEVHRNLLVVLGCEPQRRVQHRRNRSTVAGGSQARGEGSEDRPDSGPAPAEEAPTQPQEPAEEVAKWRAEALFDYNGSESDPTELIFRKGEVLFVINKEGKWWKAKTKGGQVGIVPSNYRYLYTFDMYATVFGYVLPPRYLTQSRQCANMGRATAGGARNEERLGIDVARKDDQDCREEHGRREDLNLRELSVRVN
ncbi:hypothetical protein NLJ89_g11366 [Agrocybe chaxingu]|uniref:SH3 domain-containing protein n=1 Tax=Agrocybe chaxingu TaxID=84603 RepID=A0A9W8MPF4_9AGAR|nr:hypothetical protein NLJ89_g11366 [Agrocybe chaxingu]